MAGSSLPVRAGRLVHRHRLAAAAVPHAPRPARSDAGTWSACSRWTSRPTSSATSSPAPGSPERGLQPEPPGRSPRRRPTAPTGRATTSSRSEGTGNLFRFPLGPAFADNPFPNQAFEHAGGEIIFNLPNGLQGYLLVDAKGDRIDAGPIDIVGDDD